MKKKYLFVSMIAVALLSACSNSEDNEALDSAAAPQLTVFGTIDNGNATRVAPDGDGNAWEGNEAIGISTSGNTTEYSNVKYTNSTAGTSGSFTTTETVNVTGSSVTVNAYYPYSESVSDGSITFDISNRDTNCDFMYATATGLSKTNATAELTFAHKMNRLKFTITDEDNVIGDDTEMEYTISDMVIGGTFGITTGKITNSTSTGSVTFSATGKTAYLIYAPQSKTNLTLTIHDKTNSKYYTATIPTLATTNATEGTTLSYNVKIKGTAVQVTLTSVDITGWGTDNENGTDIDAEKKTESTTSSTSTTTWSGGSNTINVTKQE